MARWALPLVVMLGLLVPRDELPSTPSAPAAGRIEGRVVVRARPARRAPNRYPGGGGAAAPRVQDIPALVYLEGGPSSSARGGRLVMGQQDTAFVPALLVAPVGATVEFPNRDDFFHNVFSYSTAQRFDLGRYPRGESKSVRFDEPGIVKVYCEVHESMRAAIVVTPSAHHAVLAPDGSFVLDGVPPGTHRLVVWHVDLGTAEADVSVTDGGVARVELTLG